MQIKNKKCILIFFLIGLFIFSLSYRFFIYEKFETRMIERDDLEVNTIFKLAELTNFKWDVAKLSISSEYFEKIAFYNKGLEVYRESVKFDSDVKYESQYLFESNNTKNVISSFQCSYSSSIRLKKIEQISEGKVTFYIYEPIGCTPIN